MIESKFDSIKNDDFNNVVLENLELSSQELMLLKSLKLYYKNKEIFKLLSSIINSKNYISRRTIEYFVTNYALINKISYNLDEKGQNNKFFVHTSYKDQLKAHKKKYFDPFGRGIRIPFFSDDDCIITTIGQLNFYKWFFSKKVYNYCLENYNIIQNSLLNNKKPTRKYTKKKNNKVIKCLDYTIKKKNNIRNDGNIVVSFDV